MPEFPIERYDRGESVFITNGAFYVERTGIALDDTSRTWKTTNYGAAVGIYVSKRMTVKKLYAYNGAAVSGNCGMALYLPTYSANNRLLTDGGHLAVKEYLGTRLATNGGGVAQAGISQWQAFDVTDVTINPGVYWLLYVLGNTTGQLVMVANNPIKCIEQAAMMGNIDVASTVPPASGTLYATGDSVSPFTYPHLAIGGIA